MTSTGPLEGLRVVDLTADLGRYGTKLLAEYGAQVCRPRGAGSRGRPMVGPRAAAHGGVLDWWFDGAKTSIDLDLETEAGVDQYRALAGQADVVIESTPIGYLAERGIDHADPGHRQSGPHPGVAHPPSGGTGPRAGWATSDLVAGALGGVLSITGTPDEPLNSWGWQNYNFGGFCAAISALAGGALGPPPRDRSAGRRLPSRGGHRLDREPVHAVLLR